MSTESNVVSVLVGLATGATVGAFVTGWFAIKTKAKSRVQKRRAKVYIDMLAWINIRMPTLQTIAASPAKEVAFPAKEAAQEVTVPISPNSKKTFPDPDAVGPSENTDPPDSSYYRTLRARVVAFGSHDMARAFDNWTEAYLKVLLNKQDDMWFKDKKISYVHAIVVPPKEEAAPRELMKWWGNGHEPAREFRKLNKQNVRPWLPIWVVRRIDPGMPEAKPGGLTIAVERCASKELRKG